jgi:acyl-CoA thioester hydrolase
VTAAVSYGRVRNVPIHLDELDFMGMVHHGRYPLLLERAVLSYWHELGWRIDPSTSAFPDDGFLAIRQLTLNFHAPCTGVGEVKVHFWIDKFGSTSVVYGFRIMSADMSTLHVDGTRVVVKIDPKTLRPSPFTDELRAASVPLVRPPTDESAGDQRSADGG